MGRSSMWDKKKAYGEVWSENKFEIQVGVAVVKKVEEVIFQFEVVVVVKWKFNVKEFSSM